MSDAVSGSLYPGAIPAGSMPSLSGPGGAVRVKIEAIAAVAAVEADSAVLKVSCGDVSISSKAVRAEDIAAASDGFQAPIHGLPPSAILKPDEHSANPEGTAFPFLETLFIDVSAGSTLQLDLITAENRVLASATFALSDVDELPNIHHLALVAEGKTIGHVTVALSSKAEETPRALSVLFGTWNVGNAPPASDAFDLWLGNPTEELVVIGTQEATWSEKKEDGAADDVPDSKPGSDPFLSLLMDFMLPKGYSLLTSRTLGQMRIAAFLRSDVKDVEVTNEEGEATGLVGLWPNKGTLILALRISGYPVSFLSSHLAAHEGHVEDRRADFRESVRGLSEKVGFDFLHESGAVFWAGDLNYRLEYGEEKKNYKEAPKEEKKGLKKFLSRLGTFVKGKDEDKESNASPPAVATATSSMQGRPALIRSETFPTNPEKRQEDEADEDEDPPADVTLWAAIEAAVESGKAAAPLPGPTTGVLAGENPYESLLAKDELIDERVGGLSFAMFEEQPIMFPPTFKRTRSTVAPFYETKRLPAWCDRVLWTSMPGVVEPKGYWSGENIGSSDHKPVAARFALKVPAFTHSYEEQQTAIEARKTLSGMGPLGTVNGVKAGDLAKASTFGFNGGSRRSSANQVERWGIKITALKAEDIAAKDSNGTSDPYVIFTGPVLNNPSSTGTVMRTLSPVWPDADLPTLKLRLTPSTHPTADDVARALKNEWLTLSVMDWDRGTNDDLCGRGVALLTIQDGKWSFTSRLRLLGEEQGRIEGVAELCKVTDDAA